MGETYAGFDWDAGNQEKCRKHGVSTAEIESMFAGRPGVRPDPAHSQTETRFLAIGRSLSGRAVFVAFTVRERDDGRFLWSISACFMHQREVESLEEANS